MLGRISLLALLSSLAYAHGAPAFSADQLKPCFERYDGQKLIDAVPFHSEWRMQREEMCLPFCVRTPSRCASIVYDKFEHICYYFSVNGTAAGSIEHSPRRVYLEVAQKKCIDDMLAVMESTESGEMNETSTMEIAETTTTTPTTDPSVTEPLPIDSPMAATANESVSLTQATNGMAVADTSPPPIIVAEGNTTAGAVNDKADLMDAFISVTTDAAATIPPVVVESFTRDGQEEPHGRSYTEEVLTQAAPLPEESPLGGEALNFGLDGVGEPAFIPIVSGFKAVRRPTPQVDVNAMPSPAPIFNNGGELNEPSAREKSRVVDVDEPGLKPRKEPIEIRRHPTAASSIAAAATTTPEPTQRTPVRVEPVLRTKSSAGVLQQAPSIFSIVPSNAARGNVRSGNVRSGSAVIDSALPFSQAPIGHGPAVIDTSQVSIGLSSPATLTTHSHRQPVSESWGAEGLSVISTACQRESSAIWLAVENSQPEAGLLQSTALPLVKSAPGGAPDCIQACASLTHMPNSSASACDSFTYLEREKQCVLHSLGGRFPYPAIVPAQRLDFNSRLFHRFCYPGNLPPFANCAEFLAFRDYSLLEVAPKEMFNGLPSGREGLSACVELCVLASDYRCKSASFDSSAGICQLFSEHSLSRPADFREHQLSGVLYFENGCVDVEPYIVDARIVEGSEYRRWHNSLRSSWME